MPKKPMRPKRRIHKDLTIPQLNLACGHDLLDEIDGFMGWSHEKLKEWWFKNREYIMSLRDKTHPDRPDLFWFKSGDRPWFWWQFEGQDFDPELTGSWLERRKKMPLKRFEHLKKNKHLFPGEEQKFFEHIQSEFEEKTRRWSRNAAEKNMKIELNYMQKWAEKCKKHTENG